MLTCFMTCHGFCGHNDRHMFIWAPVPKMHTQGKSTGRSVTTILAHSHHGL
jgi:hypothetical protein